MPHRIVVVIPAYQPGAALPDLVEDLMTAGYSGIVVVDDGSDKQSGPLFADLARLAGVSVLHHAVNLGKGAALKTGLNHALYAYPEAAGIVTADADGQHHAEDIRRVACALAKHPDTLIMGVRVFHGNVPLRSRLGNVITRRIFRALTGQSLSDTQTGLRGIPRRLAEQLLRLPSSGYEFELDMLIVAQHHDCAILEEPVRTIYEPGNPTSHFHPLRDSMRIYFVLLRFGFVSLMTAAIDNAVFVLLFPKLDSVALAQIAGRGAALIFNYTAARRAVFLTRSTHRITLPRYLMLVAASGLVSYSLIEYLHQFLNIPVLTAKLSVETLLFFANFLVQRDFVFVKRNGNAV